MFRILKALLYTILFILGIIIAIGIIALLCMIVLPFIIDYAIFCIIIGLIFMIFICIYEQLGDNDNDKKE